MSHCVIIYLVTVILVLCCHTQTYVYRIEVLKSKTNVNI